MLKTEPVDIQYGSKSFFIREVDQKILPMIRMELVSCYYNMMIDGDLQLPDEIGKLASEIEEFDFKHDLFRCVAEWYVETEIAIDTLRRISLYQVLDKNLEKVFSIKFRKVWELQSEHASFPIMALKIFCYIGSKMGGAALKLMLRYPVSFFRFLTFSENLSILQAFNYAHIKTHIRNSVGSWNMCRCCEWDYDAYFSSLLIL